MRLHYKTHFVQQESADKFRAYFQAFRDLGPFTTAQEAFDALDKEQRELDRKLKEAKGNEMKNFESKMRIVEEEAVTVNGEIYSIDDIAIYMDEDIREKLHSELAPCEPQKFVDRYAEEHNSKFGETFAIN